MKKTFVRCILILVLLVVSVSYVNAESPKSTKGKFTPTSAVLPDSPFFESKDAAEKSCTCTHQGSSYSKGSTVCINKVQFECGCSGWFKTGRGCSSLTQLGIDLDNTRVRASKESIEFTGPYEKKNGMIIITDVISGTLIPLNESDIKIDGNKLLIKKGAKPSSPIASAQPGHVSTKGCTYQPDECDSEGESGCSFCTGALLWCCGGGLTGTCVGVWGCP